MSDAEGSGKEKGYAALVQSLREHHKTIDPQNISWRKEQLRAMKQMLEENEALFLEALRKDLGTNPTEGGLLQLGLISSEIAHALKHIDRWAKPQKVSTPLHLKPSSARIVHEPLGTALIMGAWNYPLLLTLSPLVGCIAAGNAAVIKPSMMSPATSALLAKMLPRYLDKKAFQVVEGDVPEATALLKERFDAIFFTGSAPVGRIVMAAAAKHLTPVTLELGGQSPCIVDSSANLKLAALRIVFAKFANAGQTCVAPNHIFVHKDVADEFTEILKKTMTEFYGQNPQASPDYGRIVNAHHHQRLVSLMKGQNIACGGGNDPRDLYIAPTLLTNVNLASPVMQEEIFGPILPIVAVDDLSQAFNHIGANKRPLAVYVFTGSKKVIDQAEKINAGAVCINNAMVHLGVHDLPFGGVGESGFGQYHGKAGFETFSHAKPIFRSGSLEAGAHYPPYDNRFKKLIRRCFGL
jgi:aldehyde dehydrogenase (NAD+)